MKLLLIILKLILIQLINIVEKCNSEPCYQESVLKLNQLEARCSATDHTPSFPCENAIDGDVNSIWQPAHSQTGTNIFYVISLSEDATINTIEMLQYKWPHGRAAEMTVEFSDGQKFDVNFRRSQYLWDKTVFPHPISTDQVTIVITRVEGLIFGGFAEIKLKGCKNSKTDSRFPQPDVEVFDPNSQNPNEGTNSNFTSATIGSIVGGVTGFVASIFFLIVIIYLYVTVRRKKNQIETNPDEESGDKNDDDGSSSSSSSSSGQSNHDPDEIQSVHEEAEEEEEEGKNDE